MSKIIIISAPSGTGKSTIIHYLMSNVPELNLCFSISATSRPPRGAEQEGVEYYFLTEEAFRKGIAQEDFIEYEEVYPGKFYGTLKSEITRIHALDKNVILDIDVLGALNIKKMYGPSALTIFVKPPSLDALRKRLEYRNTDTSKVIEERIRKAEFEINHSKDFDACFINDDLSKCCKEIEVYLRQQLK
ncbi:guanylate kinase [Porphyromonas pogonae]|uniref:guanylate kinase n=1 Tax=Porphyromonas pogonae TaxID=867595 RepID=UPI002E76DB0D|nr:guanylate kinase [Porphyromonas pogonae]